MSAPPLRLKGVPFGSQGPVGDYSHVMDTASTISPPAYRFPDVPPPQYPSRSRSPPSSPFDSPSPSTSALPSANSSSLSLRPSPALVLPPTQPPSPVFSLRDFYLPTLTPGGVLDTLDHLASIAPKKKSHARKQPAGHIPRPRNAFILFRCLFVSQQAVPASVEKDHRNISRIAGKVWKSMSNEERDPWVKASELEKARHEAKWPGYRYNPVQPQAAPRRPAAAAPPRREDDAFYRYASVPPPDAKAALWAPQFALPPAAWYPPASPPPTPTRGRLAARRSSSCPPLPPGQFQFPFADPDPWAFAHAYAPPAAAVPPPPAFAHAPDARLSQRRGSSLDRAIASTIASSSIAGAFGRVQWSPAAFRRPSQPDMDSAPPTACTDSPRSALSPQSSFELPRGRSPCGGKEVQWNPAALHNFRPHEIEPTARADSPFELHAFDPPHEIAPAFELPRGRPRAEIMLACARPSVDLTPLTPASSPPPPSPRARVPARLFGSQGARLGLDLDLDLDLDLPLLDVAPYTPPESAYSAASTPYTESYAASPESAYPYTPSPGGSGSGPYPFSYTQALMDTAPAPAPAPAPH